MRAVSSRLSNSLKECVVKALGTLEVHCDAPPYPIVLACNAIGIEKPEDVRWIKIDHNVDGEGHPLHNCIVCELRKAAKGKAVDKQRAAKGFFSSLLTLGGMVVGNLPKLAKYRFTYSSGDEVTYSVGQCKGCRTVFWNEG